MKTLTYLKDCRPTESLVFSFLPTRHYAQYLPSSFVCLSVCLTQVGCSTKMAKPRITQTTPRDSQGTLVFWRQQPLVGDAPFSWKFVLKVTHPLSNTNTRQNDFDHWYTMLVLLRPPNFHRYRCWLSPNQHRYCAVLQCFRRSFWALFPENCPSLSQSSDSHLNVPSFDPDVTSTCFRLTPLALTPTTFATSTTIACQRKTPPPTKLQIPATVTTLHHVIKTSSYHLCKWQSVDTSVLIADIGKTVDSQPIPIIGASLVFLVPCLLVVSVSMCFTFFHALCYM